MTFQRFALQLSDHISSLLKSNFDATDVKSLQAPYASFVSAVPAFAYIGLFKTNDKGLIVAVDPKIIYVLANRMMGGRGIMERKTRPAFTLSEQFLGEEIMGFVQKKLAEANAAIQLERIEHHISHVHYFYPSDPVTKTAMFCKFNNKSVGYIYVGH